MNQIDGHTRVFGIIADPIAQVRTPQAVNALLSEQGAQAVFVPFHVAGEDLAAFVAGLKAWKNLPGFTLTIPHKEATLALCDLLGPMAQISGSVNAVRKTADGRWEGETFDGLGFVSGLRAQSIDPMDKRIYLLGAGGAAKAIAAALADAGAAHIAVGNRSAAKAAALVDRINAVFPDRCAVASNDGLRAADIVVNATSVGLSDSDGLPINVALLQPHQIAAEVIMQPETTAFLHQAEARGCRIHRGIHMLHGQLREITAFLGM